MKSVLWLLAGVVAGVALGRQLERNDQGRRFFSDVEAKARDFRQAVTDGYRARESELRSAPEGR